MEIITNKEDPHFTKLNGLVKERLEIEQKMAGNLLTKFNENADILNELRAYIVIGAKHIMHLCELKGGDRVFQKAYRDAKNYEWVRNNLALGDWYVFKAFLEGGRNMQGFNASQCSDIIRFYGEITEAAAGLTSWMSKDLMQGRENGTLSVLEAAKLFDDIDNLGDSDINKRGKLLDKQRKSHQRSAGVSHNEYGTFFESEPDRRHWHKYKTEETPDPRRLRKPRPAAMTEGEVNAAKEKWEHVKASVSKIDHDLVKTSGGISRWWQLDEDVANKMNRVFGLARGATISGTTTDTLYFFDRVTAQKEYLEKCFQSGIDSRI